MLLYSDNDSKHYIYMIFRNFTKSRHVMQANRMALYITVIITVLVTYYKIVIKYFGRPGSSEVPRNPLTRWDESSIPANGIFLTKKLKNKNKNAQRVENS